MTLLRPLRQPAVRMRRRLDDGQLEPREYRVSRLHISGRARIEIGCPACGARSDLGCEYTVHRGRVSPIWLCPSAGCPAADYLLLEEDP